MPAFRPPHNLFDRVSRAVCCLAGIFLLLLQMLGPALASSGDSMWIEICSEAGAVWVEVDLEEGTDDPTAPCPKCADCALCAVTTAAPLPDLPLLAQAENVQIVSAANWDRCKLYNSKRLWPETRGPPAASKHKPERAVRASIASIQVFGGALWS